MSSLHAAESGHRASLCAKVLDWFSAEWAPVLFVVSLVTVLHGIHFLAPVSHVSLLILANFHSGRTYTPPAGKGIEVLLVGIDEEDFDGRYQERRPLYRCALADDLEWLLEAGPKVLAIDLDLSPLAKPSEAETQCQDRLDQLLDGDLPEGKKATSTIVLIEPFVTRTPEFALAKMCWRAHRKNALFTDADIAYPFHLAIESRCISNGFAETAFVAAGNDAPCGKKSEEEPRPLNYKAYQSSVSAMSMTRLRSAEAPPIKDRTVFFGTRFGHNDEAVTPIGRLFGVDVHAAKYASYADKLERSELWNFGIDIVFAAAYSAFISWFMHHYTHTAGSTSDIVRARRSLKMLGFVAGYVAIITGAMAFAWLLITHKSLVTEPLLVALGLAFDGFVLAGWMHVAHDEKHRSKCPTFRHMLQSLRHRPAAWVRSVGAVSMTAPLSGSWLMFRALVFWLVVAVAIFEVSGMKHAFT